MAETITCDICGKTVPVTKVDSLRETFCVVEDMSSNAWTGDELLRKKKWHVCAIGTCGIVLVKEIANRLRRYGF